MERKMSVKDRAFEVVEEAVTEAVYWQLRDDLEGKVFRVNDDWDEILEIATGGTCWLASVKVLEEVAKSRGGLFSDMYVIRVDEEEGVMQGKWKFHSYFILKDREGGWYAGSPGNHKVGEDESRLTRIICGESLNGIMEEIVEIEGGEWPNGDELNLVFAGLSEIDKQVIVDENEELMYFTQVLLNDGYLFTDRVAWKMNRRI